MNKNRPEYASIRIDVIESLQRYAEHGIPPGGFLLAVLENDLHEAVARADADNVKTLKHICQFVWWELPAISWGSPQRVRTWLENTGPKGDV